jgi:hypothetical protein
MASEEERSRNIKDLIHRELILESRELTEECQRLIAQMKKLVDEMRSLRAKIKSRSNQQSTETLARSSQDSLHQR